MTRGVICGRVSRAEQAKGQSPDDQVNVCTEAMKRERSSLATATKDGGVLGEVHKGISTRKGKRKARSTFIKAQPGVFMDLAVSGDTFGNALLKMIEYAAHGEFDEVYVWKLDRLSRVPKHQASILDSMKKSGVRVFSVTEGGFISDETISGMMGVVAFRELKNIRENVKRGIHSAISKGHRVGRPPAGFVLVESTRLVPTDDALQVEALTVQGMDEKQIATELKIEWHRVVRIQRNIRAFREGRLDTYDSQKEFNKDQRDEVMVRIEGRKERLEQRRIEVRKRLIDLGG